MSFVAAPAAQQTIGAAYGQPQVAYGAQQQYQQYMVPRYAAAPATMQGYAAAPAQTYATPTYSAPATTQYMQAYQAPTYSQPMTMQPAAPMVIPTASTNLQSAGSMVGLPSSQSMVAYPSAQSMVAYPSYPGAAPQYMTGQGAQQYPMLGQGGGGGYSFEFHANEPGGGGAPPPLSHTAPEHAAASMAAGHNAQMPPAHGGPAAHGGHPGQGAPMAPGSGQMKPTKAPGSKKKLPDKKAGKKKKGGCCQM